MTQLKFQLYSRRSLQPPELDKLIDHLVFSYMSKIYMF
jgi:hypothetical protein